MTGLSTFFVLLTLICYLSATQSVGRVKAASLYALCACFIVLGIFSKENAVLAVPLILLYDYVFIAPASGGTFSRRLVAVTGIAVASLAFTSYYLGFHRAAVDVANLFMSPDQVIAERGWTAVDVHWTPLQHLMTELRVVGRYLIILAVPLPQLLIFDWWGFPLSRGLTDPVTTLASLFVITALLFFSAWKLRTLPFLCFGILWYFIALSLESFLGVGSDLYFEHRNYLPVSGLFIGIAVQIVLFFEKGLTDRRVWAAALILCTVLGSLTFVRNAVWRDSITLWRDTAAKAPSNIRAVLSLGNAYYRAMDFDNAERAYRQAVSLSSRDKRAGFLNDAAYTLGMMYLFRGDLKEAKALTDAFEAGVESYRSAILRGFYKALTKDPWGALEEYAAVIGRTEGIDTVVVHTLMGDACRDLGLFAEALEHYARALSIDPGFGAAHYGSGAAYMGLQDMARAQEFFGKALAVEPDNPLALADMADLMLIRKATNEALAYAERAVSRMPPFYRPYLSMANVLIVAGRDGEAESFYREALSRGMAEYMVPFGKARSYYMKGDSQKMEFYLAEVRKHRDLPEAVRRIVGEGRQGG